MLSGKTHLCAASLLTACALLPVPGFAADTAKASGYYRDPALHGETIVFASEGDLWTVPVMGGAAHRLTSNTGTERVPSISPDGRTVAFSAQYEGPSEVYTIPITGGVSRRRTYDGNATPDGWTPDGRLIVRTTRYSTLPESRIVLLGEKGEREMVPLAQASEAAYSTDGKTLFFTRWNKQPSVTKRYKGGWAQNLWRFDGAGEAVPLTADYTGTSHAPMVWDGQLYFLSDRDGVMNVYSMNPDGGGLKQESHQHGFDVVSASVADGRVVYACGADLWLLDLKTGHEQVVPITLESDFDQLREHWVKKPGQYVSDVHIAPDGSSAVLTARGEIFTVPAREGRIVKVAADSKVRFREARFLPDGKNIVALSTVTGETEYWKFPANGVATEQNKPEQWTHDANVLRWEGIPSPDGKLLAHRNKNHELYIYDIATKKDKLIARSTVDDFSDLRWSPDSRWLAYVEAATNLFSQIKIFNAASEKIEAVTSNRYNSMTPAWSTNGKWLYFLSDRTLESTVQAPWGPRNPDPHFPRQVKIYEVALQPGLRSPFLAFDELHPESAAEEKSDEKKKEEEKKEETAKDTGKKAKDDEKKSKDQASGDAAKKKDVAEVKIDFAEMASRLTEVPVKAGDYGNLQITDKRLCWTSASDEADPKAALECLDIDNKGDGPERVLEDVRGFEISLDRKKLLVGKDDDLYIFDSDVKPGIDGKVMAKARLDLSRWMFSTNPREEYRGIFLDAWRLERDYFYDRGMQGVDWKAMQERYLPLVDRVSDRDELNDVVAQMVSELSALHTFVAGGDHRDPLDEIDVATLGATLRRDERAGGYVVEHVILHDPDLPMQAPPLARQDSLVKEGEVVVSIDGTPLLSVDDERKPLRGKAGMQVLLKVKSKAGEEREVLVKPIKAKDEASLRYSEWEYTRRLKVEAESKNSIGYIHLRAMGDEDIAQWTREYYPVFDRQGLIIDVRHNQGGNIDSWLLGKLLRQAWFYWQPRIGDPYWNMQQAFRGHIVVLCDEATASDGEAFSEGFKRFKLGPVIGTRTWGGEIWLSGSNVQADGGIATAAETGVYGPEGKWLIEGHGVDPDILVDNLPAATYKGEDAQLQAAMDLLKKEILADPRPVPKAPPYPDKSFKY